MSDFYANLAARYDDIFPAEPEIAAFIKKCMGSRKRILDIACGTGSYALELSSLGFEVTGIDLDCEMISRAKGKDPAGGARFLRADMTDGIDSFSAAFEGIYCIGNSLPHLPSREDVTRALTAWISWLLPDGVLLIQTVNFDRFRPDGETELPPVKTDDIIFTRRYASSKKGKVSFVATLDISGEPRLENSVDLLILDHRSLVDAIQAAGFGDLELFGSYAGDEFDPSSSFLTICRAKRGQ
jgi:SAM-dependent methyltransferase